MLFFLISAALDMLDVLPDVVAVQVLSSNFIQVRILVQGRGVNLLKDFKHLIELIDPLA